MWYDQTGLPWVAPSPNIPSLATAIVYPGTCLFEGTNVSEGRGTTPPFEMIGAPWIDGQKLAEELPQPNLPGRSVPACGIHPDILEVPGQGVPGGAVARHGPRQVRTGAHGVCIF